MMPPVEPAPPPRRSRLLTVSWGLIITAILLGLYANSIMTPYRSGFSAPPKCYVEETCTSADIRSAEDLSDRWLLAAFIVFLVAIVLHFIATPSRVTPRQPLTVPWLRAFMSSVIGAALVVALVVPFIVLAFSGQTAALILLVMVGTFLLAAVPSLSHVGTWARPRMAKLVVALVTLAAPAAAMAVNLVLAALPVPDTDTMQTVGGALMVVATVAAHTAGHRLAILVGGGTPALPTAPLAAG
ncbi:hypothetical protein ACPCG0_08785 [Propionibacteriaceae bacterium Y1923]|uniref:hypothetical protein n=1 Tax=Aestuariimicrobium sp. Y1814 TaxID=3418742 RepID=UPI003C1F5216